MGPSISIVVIAIRMISLSAVSTTSPDESLDRSRLARLCATTFLHFIGMGIYMSSLPLYVHFELGGSKAMVGIAVGAFFPAAVVLRPVIGTGLDSWGRRPFLLAATATATVASGLFFLAGSVWIVVALRLLQGFAGAAYYTGAATVATDLGPQERRAEVISLFSLFLYGGFAIGPAIGEWLVGLGGFSLVWATALTVSAASFLIALGLPETLVPTDERRTSRFGLSSRAVAPGLVLMCAASGYTAITSFTPLYAREIGMSNSGGLYATFSVTILAIRILARKLADRRGRLTIVMPGLAGAAVGLLLLAVLQVPVAAYAGVAIYGIGFALLFPALMAFTADRVPESQRGSALATFTLFFDLGSGIGSYVVGTVAQSYGFGAGYGLPAFLCAGAFTALAVRTLLRQRPGRAPRRSSPASADP
ncbi:MAG: hypothetical protein QOK47_926 [Actinomycetota bacterium]|nr:hypothetical protein [Actinomycetota bacterium]